MADIIKVKAKKTFDWNQDNKYIFLKVPMPGHNTIKNLQIFLSDLILRITSTQKKSVQTVDFSKQIDYLSPENKFVLIDGVVNATLKKKNTAQKWENLNVQNISLAQLKTRRRQSEARYQQNIKQVQQIKQQLKHQYDRKATQQFMRFEQQQRKKLQKRKEDQKQAALNQVFRNINQKTGKIQYEGVKWQEKGAKDLQVLYKQQQQQLQRQKQQRKRKQQEKYLKQIKSSSNNNITQKNNSMFTEQDIRHYDQIRNNIQEQIEQIPVRKEAKVNVKFTQKLYPNVATRDYHYTEPPMPKNSTPLPPPKEGDLQNRNPLWLKDRGDGFMRNKNYSSALDAYNQALKMDQTNKRIIMNRSLANMKLLNLDSTINDCDTILLQMQKQLVNNQQNKQQSLMDMIKIKVRKNICLAWKGKLCQSKQGFKQILEYQLSQQIKSQIQNCLAKICLRQQSIKLKLKGDQCVKRQSYPQSIQYYRKSIEIDTNQYSLSNKALSLNKIQNYQESIKNCDEGIKIIQQFITYASGVNKSNNQYVGILMKLLYRKSNAQQALNQRKQAQATLKRALQINANDNDVKLALKAIKLRQTQQQFKKLKEQASLQLTKNNNPQQALTIYNLCLKLCQSPDKTSQYLSILQNQCVCFLKLQQFDNIIAVSIRILNIVNNIKNKIVQFGQRKQRKDKDYGLNKQMLNKIMVRTLVRRANAYLKVGQIYNAKSDLQKAVEVDPSDEGVKKQLLKLKETIGAK